MLKKISSALLCFISASIFNPPVWAQEAQTNEAESSPRAQFAKVYRSYSEAIEKNDFTTAAPLAKQAFELGQAVYDPASETVATLAFNYGGAMLRSGQPRLAYPILQDAASRHQTLFGAQSEKTLSVLLDVTRAAVANKNVAAASNWLPQIEAILVDVANPVLKAEIFFEFGVLDLETIRSGRAEQWLKNSVQEYEKAYGKNNSYGYFSSYYLARHYLIERNYPAAQSQLEMIIEPFSDKESGEANYARLINAYLAAAYFELGELEKGQQYQQAADALTPAALRNQPIVLLALDPDFPERAETNKIGGYVVISYNIDATGKATDAEMKEINGYAGFQQAALDAVNSWRFLPRYQDGKAISVAKQEARVLFSGR